MKLFAIQYLLVALWPVLPGSAPDPRAVVWPTHQDCDDARKDWMEVPGVKILVNCKLTNGTERIVIHLEDLQ